MKNIKKKQQHRAFHFVRRTLLWGACFGTFSQLFAINLNQYSRSFSLVFDKIEDSKLDRSYVRSDYDMLFSLGLSYVDSPLVAKPSWTTQSKSLIKEMTSLNFGAAYYQTPWLMFALSGSYSSYLDNNDKRRQGLGDLEVLSKIRLLNEGTWAVSVLPFATLPMGSKSYTLSTTGISSIDGESLNPLSDEEVGYGIKLATEYLWKYAQIAMNIGYRRNSGAKLKYSSGETAIDMSEQLSTALGVYVPIYDSFGANVEWVRLWSAPLINTKINPNELSFMISAGLTNTLHGFAGIALGNLLSSSDGNDYRAMLGVKYAPCFFEKSCRVQGTYNDGSETKIEKSSLLDESNAVTAKILPEDASLLEGQATEYSQESVKDLPAGEVYVVRYPKNVAFLTGKEKQSLRNFIQKLKGKKSQIKEVLILGHASAEGNQDLNQWLSMARARLLRRDLEQAGFSKSQVRYTYFGSRKPVANELGDNRRVEMRVIYNDK